MLRTLLSRAAAAVAAAIASTKLTRGSAARVLALTGALGDLQQVYVRNAGRPNQSLSVLNLSQSVDDTRGDRGCLADRRHRP